tara:strand:+ start:1635 stop:2702 length:1068 start_codon:yes stop_codon:yes gene_type:complete
MLKMIKSFEPTLTTKDAYKIYQLILSGDIGFGSNVKEFEDKFSEYSNKKYNIGLNSASAAAYCLFSYLYDKHGSCNVYTPSLGFTSVSWAAEKNGHRVIFVDVDDNLLFDFDSYKSLRKDPYIRKNESGKTILMPVLYGGVSNIPNFNEQVTDEIVVVDSAHCIQPTIESDFIFFSFHPIKPLAMSCGGLLATDGPIADEYIRSYRNFGRENVGDTYDIVNPGFNFYMNNLNATLGLSQLDTCFKNIEKRKYNLEYLQKSITLDIGRFTEHDEKSSYYLGTLILNERGSEDLRHKLINKGCSASFHYPYLHLSQYYNSNIPLGNLEDLDDRIINLPIHQNLTEENLQWLIKIITK